MQKVRGIYVIGNAEIGSRSWQGSNVKEESEQAYRWRTRRQGIELISETKEVIDEIKNVEENQGEELIDVLVMGILKQIKEDGRIQEGMIDSVCPR